MDQQELAETYRTLADEELVKLAADDAELTDEARAALASEMSVRGLGKRDIELVQKRRLWDARKKERREADQWFGVNNRSGRKAYGKVDCKVDPVTGAEEYTTTLFYTFASFVPLIPIATYRIKRRKGWNREVRDLQKLPLDWNLVLGVWCASAVLVVAALGAVKLLLWVMR